MNSGTRTALRRIGLALAVGSIAAGGAFAAADSPDGLTGVADAAAVPGVPAGGDSDMAPIRDTAGATARACGGIEASVGPTEDR